MPWLLVALLFRIFMEVMRVSIRARREARPNPLCTDCFYAHMQYGARAQRAISCTYGGFVRPMKLDVLYCTDYRTRDMLRTREIGFVREVATAE